MGDIREMPHVWTPYLRHVVAKIAESKTNGAEFLESLKQVFATGREEPTIEKAEILFAAAGFCKRLAPPMSKDELVGVFMEVIKEFVSV